MNIEFSKKYKGYFIGYGGGGHPAHAWTKNIESTEELEAITKSVISELLRTSYKHLR